MRSLERVDMIFIKSRIPFFRERCGAYVLRLSFGEVCSRSSLTGYEILYPDHESPRVPKLLSGR